MSRVLYVAPTLYAASNSQGSSSSKRSLAFAFSPLNNQVAVFAHPDSEQKSSPQDETAEPNVDLICIEDTPAASEDRRIFCVDTSIITATYHQMLTDGHEKGHEYPLERQEYREIARKLAVDFMNFAKEIWVHSSKLIERGLDATVDPEHYRIIKTCLDLFITMELPDIGNEDAVVADEIMEWLNVNFVEPSTEEGDHLSSLSRPWEDENFWPYLVRTTMRGLTKAATFFLQSLKEHPSEQARHISSLLVPILSKHPRLQNYDSKVKYAKAWHSWKEEVKTVRVALDRIPTSSRQKSTDDWWTPLSDMVGILEGQDEVVVRVCKELGADWKELCAVWCIFVEPGLKRGLLPEAVEENFDQELPHDPTSPEDRIHFYLFTRQHAKALAEAAKLDPWLAAHLALFMEPLQLLESEPLDEDQLSLREQYMLAYAEYLHSDSTLWRIVTQYMYTCGPIGQARADQILVHVPARLSKRDAQRERQTGQVEHVADGDHKTALDSLSETCSAYKRELARRDICRIAARNYLSEKNYSQAISYYLSACDSVGVGRVVNEVLEDHILNGPETFTRFVIEVIDPLFNKHHKHPALEGIFYARLLFVVCYARFHRRLLDGDLDLAASELGSLFRNQIVPRSWWAVLLLESLDLLNHSGAFLFTSPEASMLLHHLEEIHTRSSQGSAEEYLSVLTRKTKATGLQEALLSLREVRLALARYHARHAVIGVSGHS